VITAGSLVDHARLVTRMLKRRRRRPITGVAAFLDGSVCDA